MVSFSQFLLAVNTLAVILRNESTRHETLLKWIEVSILACRVLTLTWVGICLWNLLSQGPSPISTSTSLTQTQDNYKGIKVIVLVVLGLLNLVSLLFSIILLCFFKTRGPRVLKLLYTDLGIAIVVWFMFILIVLLLTTNGTKPVKGNKHNTSNSRSSVTTSTGTRISGMLAAGNSSTSPYSTPLARTLMTQPARRIVQPIKQKKQILKDGKTVIIFTDSENTNHQVVFPLRRNVSILQPGGGSTIKKIIQDNNGNVFQVYL